MKITTGTATQEQDIAAETAFLNVPWTITETQGEEEVMLAEGAQAFPLAASEDDIKDFLNRKLATFQENLARHEVAKVLQAQMDNASAVAGQISNLEVEI